MKFKVGDILISKMSPSLIGYITKTGKKTYIIRYIDNYGVSYESMNWSKSDVSLFFELYTDFFRRK